MSFEKIYKDYLPPEEGRSYRIIPKENGTCGIEDVTVYLQKGNELSAKDLNEFVDFCKKTGSPLQNGEIDAVIKEVGLV